MVRLKIVKDKLFGCVIKAVSLDMILDSVSSRVLTHLFPISAFVSGGISNH